MPWPFSCANCASRNIQAAADEVFCLDCGMLTDLDGVLVPASEQFSSEELPVSDDNSQPSV